MFIVYNNEENDFLHIVGLFEAQSEEDVEKHLIKEGYCFDEKTGKLYDNIKIENVTLEKIN